MSISRRLDKPAVQVMALPPKPLVASEFVGYELGQDLPAVAFKRYLSNHYLSVGSTVIETCQILRLAVPKGFRLVDYSLDDSRNVVINDQGSGSYLWDHTDTRLNGADCVVIPLLHHFNINGGSLPQDPRRIAGIHYCNQNNIQLYIPKGETGGPGGSCDTKLYYGDDVSHQVLVRWDYRDKYLGETARYIFKTLEKFEATAMGSDQHQVYLAGTVTPINTINWVPIRVKDDYIVHEYDTIYLDPQKGGEDTVYGHNRVVYLDGPDVSIAWMSTEPTIRRTTN